MMPSVRLVANSAVRPTQRSHVYESGWQTVTVQVWTLIQNVERLEGMPAARNHKYSADGIAIGL
jgi:hypothetical protein